MNTLAILIAVLAGPFGFAVGALLAARPRPRPRGHIPMPEKFEKLAAYNAARSRGVLFEPETVERNRLLQAEFNTWIATQR